MRRRRVALAVGLFTAAVLVATGCVPTPPAAAPPYTVTPGRGGAVQNVQFWYQGITADAVKKFGSVGSVVATVKNGDDESQLVSDIHSIGAKAYRYFQAYWYPETQRIGGQRVADNLDWAYCRSGGTPLVGRVVDGVKWYVMDNNEKTWRNVLRAELARIKAAGWDGVMFDRGFAALTGEDPERLEIWHRSSTCTGQPVRTGAVAADAFTNMMGEVKASGLELMQNYGISVFDPITPFRPNPFDAACRRREWDKCQFTRTGMRNAAYFVDEAASHNGDFLFASDYMANQANEKDAEFGGKVLTLITAGTLGGVVTRSNVYFQWNRIKLFSVPVGVFMGDDKCASRGGAGVCNRHGVYKELNNIRFGTPSTDGPQRTGCEPGSVINCVFYRRYAKGVAMVNVSPNPKTVTLKLAYGKCAVVVDLYNYTRLGKCSDTVRVTLGPWTGHPLVYRSS